jgi:hypothetical protein
MRRPRRTTASARGGGVNRHRPTEARMARTRTISTATDRTSQVPPDPCGVANAGRQPQTVQRGQAQQGDDDECLGDQHEPVVGSGQVRGSLHLDCGEQDAGQRQDRDRDEGACRETSHDRKRLRRGLPDGGRQGDQGADPVGQPDRVEKHGRARQPLRGCGAGVAAQRQGQTDSEQGQETACPPPPRRAVKAQQREEEGGRCDGDGPPEGRLPPGRPSGRRFEGGERRSQRVDALDPERQDGGDDSDGEKGGETWADPSGGWPGASQARKKAPPTPANNPK